MENDFAAFRNLQIRDILLEGFIKDPKIRSYMVDHELTDSKGQIKAISIAIDLLIQKSGAETYSEKNGFMMVLSAESVYNILNHHGLVRHLVHSRKVT